VKVTILATGFGMSNIDGMDGHIKKQTQEEIERKTEQEEKNGNRRLRFYKEEEGDNKTKRRPHIFKFRPEDLDNEEVILTVENTPTYKRTLQQLNELRRRLSDEREAVKQKTEDESVHGTISFS